MPTKLARREPRHRGETKTRYSGAELHAEVIRAAEAEVERRQSEGGCIRPHKGWQWLARAMLATGYAEDSERGQLPEFREADDWLRRYKPLRRALAKALDNARADRLVWARLVEESPALLDVQLRDLTAVELPPSDRELLSTKTLETLRVRLERLLDGRPGPTWREAPSNRDLALQIILSGWLPPPKAWPGDMTAAEAIREIETRVRTERRKIERRRAYGDRRRRTG